MECMIHACNDRMWYVENYLVPSLQKQEVDSTVWCDSGEGSLNAYIKSFHSLSYKGYTWHLQDDVIICSDFKTRCESIEENLIACGFYSRYDIKDRHTKSGLVSEEEMWYSFPCIGIPNIIALDFADWLLRDEVQHKYQAYLQYNKYVDMLFRFYIVEFLGGATVMNIEPNLVDHIDYLIGGSKVNEQRDEIVTSICFEEKNLIEDLERKFKNTSLQI